MTNEEIDEQIRYLNDKVIPYLIEYYKTLGVSEKEREFKLNQLLDEITRLENLKQ